MSLALNPDVIEALTHAVISFHPAGAARLSGGERGSG
jgi:hypothetical protein